MIVKCIKNKRIIHFTAQNRIFISMKKNLEKLFTKIGKVLGQNVLGQNLPI